MKHLQQNILSDLANRYDLIDFKLIYSHETVSPGDCTVNCFISIDAILLSDSDEAFNQIDAIDTMDTWLPILNDSVKVYLNSKEPNYTMDIFKWEPTYKTDFLMLFTLLHPETHQHFAYCTVSLTDQNIKFNLIYLAQ